MKIVTYDFSIDSIVCVDAPIGTNPDTLRKQALKKLLEKIQADDITLVFESTFDEESGSYDEDWENLIDE